MKDRTDLQVLTLCDDEDSGLVEPFLKENGYTFPVSPAYGLISNMFASSFGIPQTWIIDSQGRWQWTELGFTAESNWEDSIILKLEAANTAKNCKAAAFRLCPDRSGAKQRSPTRSGAASFFL